MNRFRKNQKLRYSRIGVAFSFLLLPIASPASNFVCAAQPLETTNIKATPANESVFYFEVSLTDGTRLVFPFSEKPTLRNQGNDLLLTTTKEEVNLPHGSVEKFTITKEDHTTGIEDLTVKAQMKRVGNTVFISNCAIGSVVSVYEQSGKKVLTAKTNEYGECSISLQNHPQGIYIIKSENITFKILKK